MKAFAIAISIVAAADALTGCFVYDSDYEYGPPTLIWEPDPAIPPACDPDAILVTGQVEGEVVDLRVESGYGFMGLGFFSLRLFDSGMELDLAPVQHNYPMVWGDAVGVFKLEAAGPLYCAGRGTNVMYDTRSSEETSTRVQLRSLTELGTCPGGEPVSGTIEGCIGGLDTNCEVSGGPLPAGGLRVEGHTLLGSNFTNVHLQLSLQGGHFLDFNTRRGGTMVLDGIVYCVGSGEIGDLAADPIPFTLSDITRLADCESHGNTEGYVNICLPF